MSRDRSAAEIDSSRARISGSVAVAFGLFMGLWESKRAAKPGPGEPSRVDEENPVGVRSFTRSAVSPAFPGTNPQSRLSLSPQRVGTAFALTSS
jgi:hypothetical protein